MCSVINGGSYYQPHLVSEIKDSSGSTVKKFDPILMETDSFFRDISRYPFLHAGQRAGRYEVVHPRYRVTVLVVKQVLPKNFREEMVNIWFHLLHLLR